MIEDLVAFVREERHRLDVEHNNMLGGAFGEVVRYRRFLDVIVDRHDEVAARLLALHEEHRAAMKPGIRQLDEHEMQQLDERERLTMRWQLEVESVYLFAKILLDKVARGIEFYFGPVRGCGLDSHDDLVKRIETYASSHQLELPDQFVSMAKTLKQDVSDFRDYQIAHEKSPRTRRAIQFDRIGSTKMIMVQIYPTDKDKQREARTPKQLLDDVDAYLRQFMALIGSNRERSRHKLEVQPSGD
jgi:hypothetical protein